MATRKKEPKRAVVFDNGGKTIDRYTIVLPDGDVVDSSTHPFSPNGFGQYSHNIVDKELQDGGVWRASKQGLATGRRCVTNYLHAARREKHLGKEVYDHTTLSKDVQAYIAQLMSEIEDKFINP